MEVAIIIIAVFSIIGSIGVWACCDATNEVAEELRKARLSRERRERLEPKPDLSRITANGVRVGKDGKVWGQHGY
jgi:hypothetical protein